MENAIWIGGVVAVALYGLWKLSGHSLDRAVDRALSDKEVDPLLEQLMKVPAARRATAFNRAVRRLWDAYERPLAIPLIRALAENHGECSIAQYWLDQVRTVEPELAANELGDSFYSDHFNPGTAASCGDAG